MKKSILTLSTALMFSGALVGCTANNGDNGRGNKMGMRDVGYYTDHNRGYNDLNNRNDRYNVADRVRNNNDNLDINDNNNNNGVNGTRNSRSIADQVKKLSGVRDAHVLITQNYVVVGLDADKDMNKAKLRSKIDTIVKNQTTGNKELHIVTDKRLVQRITNVNNQIVNGNNGNEVQSDVQGIINDVADAAKRPFQNNSK
ncbi:sporulation lipoprotein YhcN/YlaJ [Scopulibacillus darangshiensis]|uniref:Sporulation lipoprotein YhcN/YlaJ n=1 Tax=Scopulibacillus darangshiensis TaxID=442528 RepID=A0A4R2PAY0_9BACL|nr:YhcN/YlaJ family sporulation lipoprotein [Scopulibacillus darangshiensis]TCP32253.1 sporulation lipoprotein YhcN/YlaJ [Scopulibacillus darangshiensis]